jgi:hypothetical protein
MYIWKERAANKFTKIVFNSIKWRKQQRFRLWSFCPVKSLDVFKSPLKSSDMQFKNWWSTWEYKAHSAQISSVPLKDNFDKKMMLTSYTKSNSQKSRFARSLMMNCELLQRIPRENFKHLVFYKWSSVRILHIFLTSAFSFSASSIYLMC